MLITDKLIKKYELEKAKKLLDKHKLLDKTLKDKIDKEKTK